MKQINGLEKSDEKLEGTPLIKPSSTDHTLYDDIVNSCKSVFDPEIPVNIYDLGLIYNTERMGNGDVKVLMTLTAPACPVAGEMPYDVAAAVSAVDGVGEVEVVLTWAPAVSYTHLPLPTNREV